MDVTGQERPVRARRTAARGDDERLVVAVTGAATPLGSAFCRHLHEQPQPPLVVAIDARRADVPGVEWRLVDLRDPVVRTHLGDVDVLVHLDVESRPTVPTDRRRTHNVDGTRSVLDAAVEAGVGRVVVLTGAMVYGAHPDNPIPLDEDAPLRATADTSFAGDLLAMEDHVRVVRAENPGADVRVVRPALLVGSGADSVLTRHFEAPRLLLVRDSRPCWQFCHVDDLVTALRVVALAETGFDGPATVASEGCIAQEVAEAIAGRRRLELPAAVAFGTAERLHRLGVTPAPASELTFTMHPWVVPSTRLRAAGWRPVHDNESAMRAMLAESEGRTAIATRRVGRGDATATLGAAGATAAVLGAAALVRRSRRRRHGG